MSRCLSGRARMKTLLLVIVGAAALVMPVSASGASHAAKRHEPLRIRASVVDADELDPGDVVTDYGASVTVPEPGISVTANVLYQDGSEELTATTALNGDVTLSDVGDESSGSAVASGATLTPFAGIAACDDDAYGLEGMYW